MTLEHGLPHSNTKANMGPEKHRHSRSQHCKKTDLTRQTIHKALDIANTKVAMSLEKKAKTNKIKIQSVNAATGVLVGYTHFKTKTLITFSVKNGINLVQA